MLTKIKQFLARFLPLPARSAHRMNQALLQNFLLLQENIRLLNERLTKTDRNIADIEARINERLAALDKHIESVGFVINERLNKTEISITEAEASIRKNIISIEASVKKDIVNIEASVSNLDKNNKELMADLQQSTKANIEQQSNNLSTNIGKKVNKVTTNIQMIETKMLRVQQQPRLSYFVLNILDHCNLNCKGCDHFSPIAEKRFMSLQDIKNDLKQMSLLTEGLVTRIGIMGGEPLLHPNLSEILQATRKAFPKTLLQLVSNGILLLRQTDDFWNICRENNIVVVVTKYPLKLDYIRMEELAKNKGVEFSFYGDSGHVIKTSYKMPMDIDGRQDAKRSFWDCYHANMLPLVMDGRLYPCTVLPNIVHFNKKFGTNMDIEKGDYLDIYGVKNSGELLSFLSTPKPFCRFCKTTERSFGHTWERSKRDTSEWV